jgi:hypothetical protein
MFKSPKNKSRATCRVLTSPGHRSFSASPLKTNGDQRVFIAFVLTLAVVLSALYVSCETGVEEPVIIATFPLESGGIVYGGWTPIKIGFSVPMAEADTAYLAVAVNVRDHNYIPASGSVTWEDNAVYFSPVEKWKTGEKYTCFINGMFSALDGRVAVIKTELVFYTVSDKDVEAVPPPIPEIKEVVFLTKNEDDGYDEGDYDADEYWNNVIEGECGLMIRFDEEMDLSEPSKILRMEPYRNYDVAVTDNRTLAVYFKAAPYPVKKITVTVMANTHSLLGEELRQDYVFAFTEWKDDFQLSQMFILQTAEYYEQDCEIPINQLQEQRFQAGAELYKENLFVDFTYRFNVLLDLPAAMNALSKIKLIPDDERIEKTPRLLEVGLFSPDYDQTWADVEYGPIENPYRYLIVMPGGIDGLNDGKGRYLKEDITVMLDVVDWDEIDPWG